MPRPGKHSALNGIYCTSSGNCWAVGEYGPIDNSEANEALHWNGSKWSTLSTPNPGGTSANGDVSELAGLGCAGKGPGRADLWWSWLTS